MPVTKSAKKKLRQDKKRRIRNLRLKNLLRDSVKKALKSKTGKTILEAIKTADKAAQKNIIHKNKAARIKAKLSKFLSQKRVKQKSPGSAKDVRPRTKK